MLNLSKRILAILLVFLLTKGTVWIMFKDWNGEFFFASLGLIVTVVTIIGYLIMSIGLIRLKVWAWQQLLFTSVLTIILQVLAEYFLGVGSRVNLSEVLENFFCWFIAVNFLITIVFGISALIRRFLKR